MAFPHGGARNGPKYNAKKVRVRVGIAWVNFTAGDKFTNRNGPPDWRDTPVEQTNILDTNGTAPLNQGNYYWVLRDTSLGIFSQQASDVAVKVVLKP